MEKRLCASSEADSTRPGDFQLSIQEAERRRAQGLLRHEPGRTKRLLARWVRAPRCQPSGGRRRHRPELGERLLAAVDLYLLVIGGKRRGGHRNTICVRRGPQSRNVAGRLSVYGSAAVLQGCVVAYVRQRHRGDASGGDEQSIPRCVSLFSARTVPGSGIPNGKAVTFCVTRSEVRRMSTDHPPD